MKKKILLLLMLSGLTIQAQNTYLNIVNTPTSGGRFLIPHNSVFNMASSGPTTSRTVTFRMMIPSGTALNAGFSKIFTKGDNPSAAAGFGGFGLSFGSTATSTAVRVLDVTSDSGMLNYGNTSNTAVVFGTLADGNWHHITVIYNDTDLVNNPTSRSKVYFDGVFIAYASNTTSVKAGPINIANDKDLIFGALSTGGSFVNAAFDDIRIWDHSLSTAEVVADLTATINASNAPTTAGLLAAYDFEGSTINVAGGVPDITAKTSAGFAYVLTSATAFVTGSSLPKNVWLGTNNTSWTDASNWSGGTVPGSTSDVIIGNGANQPTLSTTTTISSLAIATGAALTVSAPNLTVTKSVANIGSMTLNSDSNLIQGGTATTNINYGDITVKRNSTPLSRFDYTIWSSPISSASFYLKSFSPATLDTRFYNYNESTNEYNVDSSPATKVFTRGAGYLIRMPDTALEAPATQTFTAEFIGLPNTGNFTKSIAYTDATHGYNMVGNPYPSTISAETFLTANTAAIESTLYFWRKTNGAGGSAYATYTAGGATTNTPTSAAPNGTIQVGQGFFVKAKSGATSISFTNAMRAGNTSTQFFKSKQAIEANRLWLNLTNTAGAFSQALVGYITDASQGVDIYDGKYINDNPLALTSNINNEEYTIQARALPFDASDVVPLNFKTDVAGEYTIALDHVDGLFATGQDIFLVDSNTGTETNLKSASYSFSAAVGSDNARFSLKYQKTLNVNTSNFNENSLTVYNNNGILYINSGANVIQNVKVYDIQGRLVLEQKNVISNLGSINISKITHQALIIQVTLEDNIVISKKILN